MQEKRELPACPVETTLMLIGDKWKVLILRDLMPGTKRFGELKKSVGNVSQKVLTAQLRDMEENGLVNRQVYAEVPPRVEYSLTDLGRSLKPILDAMWTWGEEYKEKKQIEWRNGNGKYFSQNQCEKIYGSAGGTGKNQPDSESGHGCSVCYQPAAVGILCGDGSGKN